MRMTMASQNVAVVQDAGVANQKGGDFYER